MYVGIFIIIENFGPPINDVRAVELPLQISNNVYLFLHEKPNLVLFPQREQRCNNYC